MYFGGKTTDKLFLVIARAKGPVNFFVFSLVIFLKGCVPSFSVPVSLHLF